MGKIKNELMDHEIGRTPVTKSMKEAVVAAAAHDMIIMRAWIRQAIQEKLERDGHVRPRARG